MQGDMITPAVTSVGDVPICARCALSGPTCCRLSPGQEELCFPVSEMERQRIVEAGPARGGLTGAPNSRSFMAFMARLFPADRKLLPGIFPPHGQHLRLATRPDGACTFLGASGCALPREARPYYCRLFPFWVSAGAVTAFDAPGCLVRNQGRTVRDMLPLLGMTRGMVLKLHGCMRLAWGLIPGEDSEPPRATRGKVGYNA